jgi:hypothetical protein
MGMQMATDIVSQDDMELEIGGEPTDAADVNLLDAIRIRTESMIRRYVRWNITEATYTQILPAYAPVGPRLQLEQPFVSAVEDVWEDRQSRGGQQSGDFPVASALTVGTDYWIDWDVSGLSREGIIFRYNYSWPEYVRTVKVEYTAGLTIAQLADEFAFVRDVVIRETIDRYRYAKARQGETADIGPVVMERLKDFTAKYASTADRTASTASGLFPESESILDSIVFYGGWG